MAPVLRHPAQLTAPHAAILGSATGDSDADFTRPPISTNSHLCLQVYVRQKNLIARRKASSCVPQAKAAVIEGPLTPEEKAKVRVDVWW